MTFRKNAKIDPSQVRDDRGKKPMPNKPTRRNQPKMTAPKRATPMKKRAY